MKDKIIKKIIKNSREKINNFEKKVCYTEINYCEKNNNEKKSNENMEIKRDSSTNINNHNKKNRIKNYTDRNKETNGIRADEIKFNIINTLFNKKTKKNQIEKVIKKEPHTIKDNKCDNNKEKNSYIDKNNSKKFTIDNTQGSFFKTQETHTKANKIKTIKNVNKL